MSIPWSVSKNLYKYVRNLGWFSRWNLGHTSHTSDQVTTPDRWVKYILFLSSWLSKSVRAEPHHIWSCFVCSRSGNDLSVFSLWSGYLFYLVLYSIDLFLNGDRPRVPDSESSPTHVCYPVITVSNASLMETYLEPQVVANTKLWPNVSNKGDFFLIWLTGTQSIITWF